MTSRLIVLGAGPEIDYFLREYSEKFNIVAYGTDQANANNAKQSLEFCKENNIKILNSLKEINMHRPDYVYMVSYPRLIPADYIFNYKFINMHCALLPKYRGIHGGTWAIINGEKHHGYTVHQVDQGIDSGPIYYQGKIEAAVTEDVNSIRAMIIEHYKAHIGSIFNDILTGNMKPIPQDESKAMYVCKRVPEDGEIVWEQPAWNVYNLIRALSPPYTRGAYTYYKGQKLYIIKAVWNEMPSYISTVGQVVARVPDQGVLIKCGDRPLLVEEVNYGGRDIGSLDLFSTVGARLG